MVVHVLTVSSKGQVVLPVSMRKAMEMESGSKPRLPQRLDAA